MTTKVNVHMLDSFKQLVIEYFKTLEQIHQLSRQPDTTNAVYALRELASDMLTQLRSYTDISSQVIVLNHIDRLTLADTARQINNSQTYIRHVHAQLIHDNPELKRMKSKKALSLGLAEQ